MQDRKAVLLRACLDMMRKCTDGYVLSPYEVTVFYDDADCDGYCLMEDIETELDLEKGVRPLKNWRKSA